MASVLRSFSQIPVRAKYFIWLNNDPNTNAIPAASAFKLNPGSYAAIGSMAIADDITPVTTSPFDSEVPPSLLKDMGRQITIYDESTKLHLAVYREVQIIDGAASEGVGGNAASGWESTYFVKVWSAGGLGVEVVRTG
jgi:hypothetical protein